MQALNCATALAKAAQLHLQPISRIYLLYFWCPVFSWCLNTLLTPALTAGGSWTSFPPSPATFRAFYKKDVDTATVLAESARTVTLEPFFPSTGVKLELNIVLCYNCNRKGVPMFILSHSPKEAAPSISIDSASIRMCCFTSTLGTAPTHSHVHAIFVFICNR